MPMDIADSYIILEKDKSKWTSADSKEELIEKIQEKISVVPGVNFVFTQPVELRFNELLTGVREDVAIKLYGEDLDVLADKVQEIAAVIREVPGAADLNVEATSGLPQMTVVYNRAKMAQYGVTVDKLNDYVSAAFAGEKAGVIFEGEKRFDVVIRLAEDFRQDINSLKNLYIDLPNGAQVPLKEVADISYKAGPMQISRDNTMRRISVGVNVRGRDVKSMVEEIQQKLETEVDRKSTRLNSSHVRISYAVFCLKKKKKLRKYSIPRIVKSIWIITSPSKITDHSISHRNSPHSIIIYSI